MLAGAWVEVVALVAAFAIAVITTPAGVSGAVLLLPFQGGASIHRGRLAKHQSVT
jgi:hypothetical protein